MWRRFLGAKRLVRKAVITTAETTNAMALGKANCAAGVPGAAWATIGTATATTANTRDSSRRGSRRWLGGTPGSIAETVSSFARDRVARGSVVGRAADQPRQEIGALGAGERRRSGDRHVARVD